MKDSELSKYFSKIGRRGGKRRLQTMTKEERRRIAKLGGSASKGKPKKAAGKKA
jgi:general stress protein YciG